MERVYVNGEHSTALLKSMAKLWKERKYCDAVLEVNSENIELHKLVLIAASPSVINKVNNITERGTIVIKLDGKCYNKEAAKLCVQYLYKGVAKLTDSNVKSVARIAETLELKEILKICSSFQDTFKLVREEISDEDDYGSDTEVDGSENEDVEQISKNLTNALEEALDNINQIEEQTDNKTATQSQVEMEIPYENVTRESNMKVQEETRVKDEPKTEIELEVAVDSIKETHGTEMVEVDPSHFHSDPAEDTDQKKFQMMTHVQLKPKQEGNFFVECPRCDTKVIGRNLMSHIKEVHLAKKKFTCSICGKIYSSKQARDSHKQSVHTRQCRNCSRYVMETVPWAKGTDRRSKRYIVCKCGFKVTICTVVGRSRQSYSDEHKQTLEKYACVTCGKLFLTKTHCQRHSLIHNDDKVFSCNRCDSRFAEQESLKKHESEEHRIKSLVCCYCSKKFSRLNTLKCHLIKKHSSVSSGK